MVCSDFAVNLQCLGKQFSGTVYSEKQRNIYEHIYRFYSPNTLYTSPVQKHPGPEKISRKHIYTEDKNFLVPLELQLEPYEKRTYKRPVLATGRGQTSGQNYIRIKTHYMDIYYKCPQDVQTLNRNDLNN